MNGSNYERALARILHNDGYHVVRSPASGAATQRELPDLLWSKRYESPVAAELKATSQNVAYYEETEILALQSFAHAFAAVPVLVARFKGDTTYYGVRVTDARVTDSNRYAVDREIEYYETYEE